MKNIQKPTKVSMVEIDKINVLNPRVRNRKVFESIADNIVEVGLKRPITLTKSHSNEAGKEYDLVCGQGRLEAFLSRGQKEIPAIIIDANEEQALIMSLVENCARRKHSAMDLMQGITILRKQGYESSEIAKKTGLSLEYTNAIVMLIERGEERLLSAVEAGHMALTVAVKIAETPDENMQHVLQNIYESGQLRGNKFLLVKKLIDNRRKRGKANLAGGGRRNKSAAPVSAQDVMKIYQKEVDRKQLLTKKAEIASNRLLFVTEALKQLLQEENFNTLLRAEGLNTFPKQLSDLISKRGYSNA